MEPQENTPALQPSLIPELPRAFAKAQGAFRTPTLNRKAVVKKQGVWLYDTFYADLEEIIDCVRKPLADNGLAFTQTTQVRGNSWFLVLELMHESGETKTTAMPIDLSQPNQQIGGALTYLKRYQLAAFMGLAADFDADGHENDSEKTASFESGKVQGSKPDIKPNPQAGPKPVTAIKPQVAPKPEDTPQDAPIEIDERYVIPFGPPYVKGKVMRDLDPQLVKTYFNTVVDTASAKNQEIKGDVLIFCAHAEAYLQDAKP